MLIVTLTLFYITPSILSTIQLFCYDIAFPHHETSESLRLPVFLSILTCYHFGGYHWEHHAYPNVAWWSLPGTRKS